MRFIPMLCKYCGQSKEVFINDNRFNVTYKYIRMLTVIHKFSGGVCVSCKLCGEGLFKVGATDRYMILGDLFDHLNTSAHEIKIPEICTFWIRGRNKNLNTAPFVGEFVLYNPQSVFLHSVDCTLTNITTPDGGEINGNDILNVLLNMNYECVLCGVEFDSFPTEETFSYHFQHGCIINSP